MLPFEWVLQREPYAFISKLKLICEKLQINPAWLMMVFWVECEFNTQIRNPHSGAIGLIQFLPSTLVSLGFRTSQLIGRYGVWQLDLVYKYLAPYTGRMHSAYDVYLAVFYPRALNKRDDFVIAYEHEKAYKYNQILDTVFGDNDGVLEVLDVKYFFRQRVLKAIKAHRKNPKYKGRIPVDYELGFY
jgi:hypothetical protein